MLSAAERILKLNLSMNFKILRDLDLLPAILGQDWSSVFLQRFGGAVTILPKTRALDWVHILSDPDRKELARRLKVGQSTTFPKLHMIENRVRLERAIEQGRKACRRASRASSGRSPVANQLKSLPAMDGASRTSGESQTRNNSGGIKWRNGYDGPRSATSLPSDTDNDDFFTSKEIAGLTKVAGSAIKNGAGGALLVDSAVGTPNEVGHSDDPPPPKSDQHSQQQRPKPYPTYSRYLIDTQGHSSRTPEDGAGRAVREWLDRHHPSEDGAEGEGEDGETQLPFLSASQSIGGLQRSAVHRRSFGSSPIHERLRTWHGKSRHSWDDRGQDFGDEEDEHAVAEQEEREGLDDESSSGEESDTPAP